MFLYREKFRRLRMLNLCQFNNVYLLGQILSVFHMTEISKQCEHLLNLVCVYFILKFWCRFSSWVFRYTSVWPIWLYAARPRYWKYLDCPSSKYFFQVRYGELLGGCLQLTRVNRRNICLKMFQRDKLWSYCSALIWLIFIGLWYFEIPAAEYNVNLSVTPC